MGIISITTDVAGQINVNPRRVKIITTDNLSTVESAGYLNPVNLQGYTILPTDVVDMIYSYNTTSQVGTYGVFLPTISNGVITLSLDVSQGNVTFPVVDGDFAVFNGTVGIIKDAGYSPTDNTKTKVVMLNAAPTINHLAIFTNANGTIGDSGARIIANTTGTFAGGGTSNTFAATGLTVNAKGSAVIRASTNSVSITKSLPGTDTLAITFSADPGASTTVDYIYVTAAQS